MGTSLLDVPSSDDPIVALMRALSSPDKATREAATLAFRQMTGAHRLPAMVSSAAPLARQLPAMVSTASSLARELPAMVSSAPRSATPSPAALAGVSGTLPAMHSVGAAPSQAPATWQVGNPQAVAAAMPITTTPSAPQVPGAIGQMMQGLLAQMQPPQPQGGLLGSPSPSMQAPTPQGAPMSGNESGPVPPPPQQGVTVPQHQNMFGRIHDRLVGLLTPSAPAGYEGLLTPEEIKGARPSIMQSLIGTPDAPSSSERYRNNLNNILQMHGIAAQMGETSRIRTLRQSIETKYPLPDNPTDAQIRTNLAQRYDAYIGAGDTEMAKEIGASLRGIMTAPKEESSKIVAPGGALVDPKGNLLYQAPGADKSSDYTQYLDQKGNIQVLKKDATPPAGWKTIPMNTTEIRVNSADARADVARSDKAVKDYTAQIKPLRERGAVIDQALKTLDDAAHNPNPSVRKTLYTSAVANFIQAADQKAQIRYQLLQYFKQNVDPSIAGKWEVLKNRLVNGTLPGYTMEGMIGHLKNLRTLTQDEIEHQRSGLVKRRPELESALPLTSEFFGDEPSSAAPTAAASLYDKYKLAPKKP